MRASTTKKRATAWTTEEDTTLLKAVDEHDFDYDRSKAENGARLGNRSANALQLHFSQRFPDKFKELNLRSWTTEEKTALFEAVGEYGLDFDLIKAKYGARLGHRKANTKITSINITLTSAERRGKR